MRYSAEDQQKLFTRSKQLLNQPSERSPEEAISQLRELIEYHEYRYYILNDPVVSDYEYDQLYKQLENLEAEHPELISSDSPTQRVSADLTEDFPTVTHLSPMLSLANSFNEQDMMDFDTSIHKLTGIPEEQPIEYAIEPKYDGGTIVLVYEDDQLIRAATRGNGVAGDEITANARVIRSIPLKAAFSDYGLKKVELRGEVLISKHLFAQINQKRAEEKLPLFANPRNTATGGLRMKNPKETAERGLEAFIFQISYALDQQSQYALPELNKHSQALDMLEKLGFKIPSKERTVASNIQEVIQFYMDWAEKREDYDYEIDGMVIKVNSFELQDKCGATSHHPRWAIAYKFKAKQATTQLQSVEYQVGKIGSITPVAKVNPVALAGVTISSISLHNEEFITSKDIRIGDFVVVERAGDVIPYIVKPITDLRKGNEKPIQFPEFCPINKKEKVPLFKNENEAAWRCVTCTCGAQDLQKMTFHVSKDAMDIDGFGRAYIERFYQLGFIRNIADIYNMDYDKIAELEGFGQKSAENLKEAIEKAKKNPLYRLLHSLSIHHLGKKASKLIAQEVNHILDLKDWTLEQFTEIKDIGPVVAENVMQYFFIDANIELLRQMEEYGVNMKPTEEDQPVKVADDAPLLGKTILFTGSLQTMTRKEAQEKAAKMGAKNISAVSSNLDILVVGEKAGSKLKKAEALGTVQILTEEEFAALLSNG